MIKLVEREWYSTEKRLSVFIQKVLMNALNILRLSESSSPPKFPMMKLNVMTNCKFWTELRSGWTIQGC